MVGAASERELGDTNGVLVHLRDAASIEVTKSLVPESTQGITVEVIDKKDVFVGVVDATPSVGDGTDGSWG